MANRSGRTSAIIRGAETHNDTVLLRTRCDDLHLLGSDSLPFITISMHCFQNCSSQTWIVFDHDSTNPCSHLPISQGRPLYPLLLGAQLCLIQATMPCLAIAVVQSTLVSPSPTHSCMCPLCTQARECTVLPILHMQ